MAEPVNLRTARKRKARSEKERLAAANRASYGRTRSERDAAGLSRDMDDRRLEAHRIEGSRNLDDKA